MMHYGSDARLHLVVAAAPETVPAQRNPSYLAWCRQASQVPPPPPSQKGPPLTRAHKTDMRLAFPIKESASVWKIILWKLAGPGERIHVGLSCVRSQYTDAFLERQAPETLPIALESEHAPSMYSMLEHAPETPAHLVDADSSHESDSPFDDMIHWRPLSGCPQGFWKRRR